MTEKRYAVVVILKSPVAQYVTAWVRVAIGIESDTGTYTWPVNDSFSLSWTGSSGLLSTQRDSPAYLAKDSIPDPGNGYHIATFSADKYRPEARTHKEETQTHHTLVDIKDKVRQVGCVRTFTDQLHLWRKEEEQTKRQKVATEGRIGNVNDGDRNNGQIWNKIITRR